MEQHAQVARHIARSRGDASRRVVHHQAGRRGELALPRINLVAPEWLVSNRRALAPRGGDDAFRLLHPQRIENACLHAEAPRPPVEPGGQQAKNIEARIAVVKMLARLVSLNEPRARVARKNPERIGQP